MTAVSSVIRDFGKTMLLDATVGFNANFPVTCATYGVQPFTLAVTSNPPTLFLGRYTWAPLAKAYGPNIFPCAVLSVFRSNSIGRQALRVTPSTFSGEVVLSVDFYIGYPDQQLAPDGDAMYFALEDAMVNTFGSPSSYSAIPAGVSYNNEIKGEPGNMETTDTGWVQLNTFAMPFNRIG